jgi:hypothetical protein
LLVQLRCLAAIANMAFSKVGHVAARCGTISSKFRRGSDRSNWGRQRDGYWEYHGKPTQIASLCTKCLNSAASVWFIWGKTLSCGIWKPLSTLLAGVGSCVSPIWDNARLEKGLVDGVLLGFSTDDLPSNEVSEAENKTRWLGEARLCRSSSKARGTSLSPNEVCLVDPSDTSSLMKGGDSRDSY